MKKQYVIPQTETVNIRLLSSVLEPDGYAPWSQGAGNGDDYADAKETDFDDFNAEEDIWADRPMKDVWER